MSGPKSAYRPTVPDQLGHHFLRFLLLIIPLTLSLALNAHAWSGRVLDKETREPLGGVVITRSWDREYATPAGMVSSPIAVKEGMTNAEGHYFVSRIIFYISIPFFASVEENRPVVFKPGYRLLEVDGHPSKILLEKIPTDIETRRHELHEAESALPPIIDSPLLRQLTEKEEEFIDSATRPAERVILGKNRRPNKRQIPSAPQPASNASADILVNEIETLLRDDDPRAVEELLKGLESPQFSPTLQAALQTGKIAVNGPKCQQLIADYVQQQIVSLDRERTSPPPKERLSRLGSLAVAPLIEFIQEKDRVILRDIPKENLEKLLQEEDPWRGARIMTARASAFAILGKIDDPRAEEYLVSIGLGDHDRSVRDWTEQALKRKGERINPSLVAALQHPNWKVRRGAADVLSWTGTDKELAALLAATADNNVKVVQAATRAIGSLQNKTAIPTLLRLAGHQDRDVRRAALTSLWETDDQAAFEPLTKALGDPDYYVRCFAAEALGSVGRPSVPAALFAALANPYQDVRTRAAAALVQLRTASAVRAGLKSTDSYLRWRAAWMLGEMRDGDAAQLLIPLLQDHTPEVRWITARALGQIGDRRAEAPLLQLMNDPDEGLRRRAETSLAELRNKLIQGLQPSQEKGGHLAPEFLEQYDQYHSKGAPLPIR